MPHRETIYDKDGWKDSGITDVFPLAKQARMKTKWIFGPDSSNHVYWAVVKVDSLWIHSVILL